MARWSVCVVADVGDEGPLPWLVLLFGRGDALGVLLTIGGGLTITPYQGVVGGQTVGVDWWNVWWWLFTIVIARTRISFDHEFVGSGRWCTVWSVFRSYWKCRYGRHVLRHFLWSVVIVMGADSRWERYVLRHLLWSVVIVIDGGPGNCGPAY